MPRKSTKTKTTAKDSNIKLVEEATEATEATTTTENISTSVDFTEAETNNTNKSEIIDVEWSDIKTIFEFKQKLEDLEGYFANMCLHFEKEKVNIMTQITYGQNDLFMMAQQLQKSMNIDENLTYELKLPQEEGQKGFFVRKDE